MPLKVKAPPISSKSFIVQLPGHTSSYPLGHASHQGDYVIGFDKKLVLKPKEWRCKVHSVFFNNSYSTYIPKTPLEVAYLVPNEDPHELQRLLALPGSQFLKHIPGFMTVRLPLRKKDDDSGQQVSLNAGLYHTAQQLVDDLNIIYSNCGKTSNNCMRIEDGCLTMTLKRTEDNDPWIVPMLGGELCQRLGIPDILSRSMIDTLDIVGGYWAEKVITFSQPIKISNSYSRNLSLYIDILNPSIPGLKEGELIRFAGNESLEMSDTNVFVFDSSILHPLNTSKQFRRQSQSGNLSHSKDIFTREADDDEDSGVDITYFHVTFRDELDQIVTFPMGVNMVILEFVKIE